MAPISKIGKLFKPNLDMAKQLPTAAERIKKTWAAAKNQGSITISHSGGGVMPGGTYSGSEVVNTTVDFLGDWRSVSNWQQFDMLRVRSRSRQIERGNPWGQSFQKSLVNNVLGSNGFKLKPNVVNDAVLYGDALDGQRDFRAEKQILSIMNEFSRPENLTTRKKLDVLDLDKLIVTRTCFDGEVIFRKIKGFDNDFKFSWQIIDPDYLDHNLNRLEENGNIIRMGIELDKDWKFPVAYWFLKRRPNDRWYNYAQFYQTLYERVPADEVIHFFVQTEDSEQVRGWPWTFAVAVNLFRMGRYEEAALVNATIGASKVGFYKKTVPDGFAGDPSTLADEGIVLDHVTPGSWVELPWNVEPVSWDSKYPDDQFDAFEKTMLRGVASCLGSSYMTLSGDVSEANFSNLRAGQANEREHWMVLQSFFIRKWKVPAHEEQVFRAILSGKLKLPIGKLEKFTNPVFVGRRWPYVNPVDDMNAAKLALDNNLKSVSQIIEEAGGDPLEVFAQISEDEKLFEKLKIQRVGVLRTTMSEMGPTGKSNGNSGKDSNSNNNPDKPKQKQD